MSEPASTPCHECGHPATLHTMRDGENGGHAPSVEPLYEGYCAAIVTKWIATDWSANRRSRARTQISHQCRRTVKDGHRFCFAHEDRAEPR